MTKLVPALKWSKYSSLFIFIIALIGIEIDELGECVIQFSTIFPNAPTEKCPWLSQMVDHHVQDLDVFEVET